MQRRSYEYKHQRCDLYNLETSLKTIILKIGKPLFLGVPKQLSAYKKIEFIDVPGHLTLYQVRKKEFNKIRKKKISGIINVVNYGYNESETAQDINIFKVGTNEVKDEYLNENRKREIKQLAEWKNEIIPECGIKFIITIINKADIWYSQREEVNNYYEIGAYAQELSKLGNLAFHYFNYCSIIEPFYNRPMTISIGEQEKKRMHDSLTKEFLDILFKQL